MNGQNREKPMVSGRFSMIFPYDLQDFCLDSCCGLTRLCPHCAAVRDLSRLQVMKMGSSMPQSGAWHENPWASQIFPKWECICTVYIYSQYSRNTNMKIPPEYWLRVVLYQFVLVESTIFVENERVWVQNWVEWNQKGWSLFRSETIHFVFYLWWGIKSWKRNITMVCSFFCSSTTHEWFAIAMFDYRRVCVGWEGVLHGFIIYLKPGDAQNPRIAIFAKKWC